MVSIFECCWESITCCVHKWRVPVLSLKDTGLFWVVFIVFCLFVFFTLFYQALRVSRTEKCWFLFRHFFFLILLLSWKSLRLSESAHLLPLFPWGRDAMSGMAGLQICGENPNSVITSQGPLGLLELRPVTGGNRFLQSGQEVPDSCWMTQVSRSLWGAKCCFN